MYGLGQCDLLYWIYRLTFGLTCIFYRARVGPYFRGYVSWGSTYFDSRSPWAKPFVTYKQSEHDLILKVTAVFCNFTSQILYFNIKYLPEIVGPLLHYLSWLSRDYQQSWRALWPSKRSQWPIMFPIGTHCISLSCRLTFDI